MISFLIIPTLVINILIAYNLDKIAFFINIFDEPDNRLKKHKFRVPLLGGIILVINFISFIIFHFFNNYDYLNTNIPIRNIFTILVFLFLFFFLGIVDDKHKLKPENKFFTSIFISLFLLLLNKDLLIVNINLSFYDNSIFLGNFSYFFTIFCIIILINAINFYDGINGQSIIFFIILFCYLSFKSPFFIFYLFITLILLFILYLNLLNKIFMGDNGIYFLAAFLSASLIYEYNKHDTFESADEIFLLLLLPGYDLLRLSFTRLLAGKNPFYGDRNHIHHKLIKKFSLIKTNLILILLSVTPIFLFSFIDVNFLVILFLFTLVYILIIFKLPKNDKKRYFRKAK
ncbi:hypothetical protein N9371_02295 [Candidatus Pelagibacter sp.]|nr:hypothetical protein [Candidatus Pelagibacter sp.]|tara:strand:- start:809 stop:1840 length:1032 start_codon:yes stop_codon:yes gene_type:complete